MLWHTERFASDGRLIAGFHHSGTPIEALTRMVAITSGCSYEPGDTYTIKYAGECEPKTPEISDTLTEAANRDTAGIIAWCRANDGA